MLWIIIAVVAVLVLWVISVQNKLVKSDEFCNNALKQINVQQISRFDALQALIKLTREYASYEAETLQKIVDARKITSSAAPTAAQINANEEALKEITSPWQRPIRTSRPTRTTSKPCRASRSMRRTSVCHV